VKWRLLILVMAVALVACAKARPTVVVVPPGCTMGPCGELCCNDDGQVCCPDWDWYAKEEGKCD